MQSFVEYYTNDSSLNQLNEFTWGQLGKGFLRFGKNIFGKRTIGISVDMLTSIKAVDRSTYNFVQGVLTTNFKSKRTEDNVYIKRIFKGEIDDNAKKIGGYENIKNQIQDISVYQTNKGGKISTFYLMDESGKEKFYIGTSWIGDKNFKDIFGMWVTSLTSRLNNVKNTGVKLKDVIEDPKEYLSPEDETLSSSPSPLSSSPNPLNDNKLGLLDISKDDYINLEELWGNDLIGNTSIKGLTYKFKGKFNREKHIDPETGYKGYKYYKNDNNVLLLDLGDGKNALIVFDGNDSYEWAKRIGMLSIWKSQPDKNEIVWRKNLTSEEEDN